MKTLIFSLACLVLLLSVTSPNIAAQDESQIFSLPEAHVGKPYRADIATVLREKYRLKLEASSEATFLWVFAGGKLPLGLAVDPHGTIIGTPETARENDYRFVLRVREESESDGLRLTFSIQVKAGSLRLTRLEGSEPRLVLADADHSLSSDTPRGPSWNSH
jgi:hypothetical protein